MAQLVVRSADGTPSLLAGRYLVGAEVGQGGMAVVYRAWDSVLSRDVAVKMMRGVLVDPQDVERFAAEGRTLAGLSHPGLIMLLDTGTQEDRPYLVMELVDGETLGQRCLRHDLDAEQVCLIGAELAEALAYVHECGIVHRDVKPSNVLLGREGRVRLADFGIARMIADTGKQTATGLTMGTAAYLSPEQVRGERPTGAADVYALALVLIEALTGRPAYSGPQNVVALARLVSAPPIDETIPFELRDLLTAMTLSRPQARPTAAEVGAQLRAMLTGGLVLPPSFAAAGAGAGAVAEVRAGTEPGPPIDPRAGWVGMRSVPKQRRNLALLLAVAVAVTALPILLLTSQFTHRGNRTPTTEGTSAVQAEVARPGSTTMPVPRAKSTDKPAPVGRRAGAATLVKNVALPVGTATSATSVGTGTGTGTGIGTGTGAGTSAPSVVGSPTPTLAPSSVPTSSTAQATRPPTLLEILERLRKLREERRKAKHHTPTPKP